MPNDVSIAGGTHKLGLNDEQGDGLEKETPNVVICTGANACGKVCYVFSPFLHSVFESPGCTECVPEAGEPSAVMELLTHQ